MPAFDRWALPLLILGGLILTARGWLLAHPEHNPWAPLNLNDPPGWATKRKIAELRDDPAQCRAVLERSAVSFATLDPAGEASCVRPDRTVLTGFPLQPDRPATTCAVAAGLTLWLDRTVQPAARELLGAEVSRIDHFGAYSCRRLYGRDSGPWSEHASGNAIDVAGFVLADGRRIAVRDGWAAGGADGAFLHAAHKTACGAFGTVLGPGYNAAHADHFHLDQAGARLGWSVCR